ncbi:MAG TPA: hypothetical protein VFV65_03690 [Gemmatimonadales bacterium]|nr:hypothetical protein [Gemmatimonadales bacterium]
MRGCFMLIGLVLLVIGLASLWVLVKIGGKSDGPGALLFYVGAIGGLWGAWIFLGPTRERP